MKKDEIKALIEQELKDNPGASSLDIVQKLHIPLKIVENFRKIINSK